MAVSVLGSEIEDRHLRCVQLSIFWLIAEELYEILFKACSFLLEPIVEVLSVKVLKAVGHATEFGGEFRTQCLLCQMVKHPDLLVANLGHALQASVLSWNIFKVRLFNFDLDRLAFVVHFRLNRHLWNLQSHYSRDFVIHILILCKHDLWLLLLRLVFLTLFLSLGFLLSSG